MLLSIQPGFSKIHDDIAYKPYGYWKVSLSGVNDITSAILGTN